MRQAFFQARHRNGASEKNALTRLFTEASEKTDPKTYNDQELLQKISNAAALGSPLLSAIEDTWENRNIRLFWKYLLYAYRALGRDSPLVVEMKEKAFIDNEYREVMGFWRDKEEESRPYGVPKDDYDNLISTVLTAKRNGFDELIHRVQQSIIEQFFPYLQKAFQEERQRLSKQSREIETAKKLFPSNDPATQSLAANIVYAGFEYLIGINENPEVDGDTEEKKQLLSAIWKAASEIEEKLQGFKFSEKGDYWSEDKQIKARVSSILYLGIKELFDFLLNRAQRLAEKRRAAGKYFPADVSDFIERKIHGIVEALMEYLNSPFHESTAARFYEKENLFSDESIRFFQRQFTNLDIVRPRYYDQEKIRENSIENWKRYRPANFYYIDPLGYIERFETNAPIAAFVLLFDRIIEHNLRNYANAYLSEIKSRMERNPDYWKSIKPIKMFPLKIFEPPTTEKARRKLAVQMLEKSQKYKEETLRLVSKDYGNMTNKRATQRDIDEEKGKRLLKYAFLFERIAELIRRDRLDPALYVLRNEDTLDLFFRYEEPKLSMQFSELEFFILESLRTIKENKEPKRKGEILSAQEIAFLEYFVHKYSKYLMFMNNGTSYSTYFGSEKKSGIKNDFIGISYFEHLDDLWSAESLHMKAKTSYQKSFHYEGFADARKLFKMGFTTEQDFKRAKAKIQEMLESSDYQQELAKIQKKIEERELLEKAMQGNQNDFFPTPPSLFQEAVLPEIRNWIKGYKSTLPKGSTFRALEPSAGVGTLALEVKSYLRTELYDYSLEMDVVEMFLKACDYLRHLGFNVHCDDFLEYKPPHEYDLIVMNPPFSTEQDIDHVLHAYDMLKEGGLLVAITSSGVVDRSNTNKVKQFQQFLDSIGAGVDRNPEGSFQRDDAPVKTGVNTVTLTLIKPKRTPNPKKRLEHWTETKFPYLPLSVVEALEPLADAVGVSEVARGVKPSSRGDRGFLVAYRDAEGQPSNLGDISVADGKEDEYWINKREDFNTRHSEQIEQNNRDLWMTYKGNYMPSRQHLALAMWAYSPDEKRLLKWMDTNKKALQALKKQKR